MALDVDSEGALVQPELDAAVLDLADAAMGERTPIGHLAGDVVGDAADREVRVGVEVDGIQFGGNTRQSACDALTANVIQTVRAIAATCK
jgi:hypothetical protein